MLIAGAIDKQRLAIFVSRVCLMLFAAHWGIIAGMLAIGAPIEWAAQFTAVHCVLLGGGAAVLVGVLLRREESARKLSEPPAIAVAQHFLVLIAAMASNTGGLVLYWQGEIAAGWWAMALATVTAVCETYALILGLFRPRVRPPDEDESGSVKSSVVERP